MITLSTSPIPEIDLSLTLKIIETYSSISRTIRTYRLCQRHWLDL